MNDFKLTIKSNTLTPRQFLKIFYGVKEGDFDRFCENFIEELYPEQLAEKWRREEEQRKQEQRALLDAEIKRLEEIKSAII